MPASPAPKNKKVLSTVVAGDPQSGVDASQRHGRSALDVVVECACAIPISLQEAEGVGISEIFELNTHFRKNFLHRRNELLDQFIVSQPTQPPLCQTDV